MSVYSCKSLDKSRDVKSSDLFNDADESFSFVPAFSIKRDSLFQVPCKAT